MIGKSDRCNCVIKLPLSALIALRWFFNRYPQEFVLLDCELEKEEPCDFLKPGEAFASMEHAMFVIFPYKDGSYRLIMSRAADKEGAEPTLDEVQDSCDLLPFKLQIKAPQWLTQFSLHARSVDQYSDSDHRVFVAGDAAHIHSPVGGQGCVLLLHH